MKYIDRLLQGAPVEWRPLGEVAEIVTDFTAAGSFASNAENVKYLKEPSYALLVRTTDLKQGFANSDNFVYVDEHAFNYLWRVNLDKESLILPNVGNCGEVYYSVPTELPHTHCVLGPNALLLRSSIVENRFLYYWFQGSDFQYKLSKITSSTGQTKFNKTNLKKLEIPIPPVAVQEEVVRILDKFTALEAELDCRRRQYQYYRDALLTFDLSPSDGLCHSPLFSVPFAVEWFPLGEVLVRTRGTKITASQMKDLHKEGAPIKIFAGGKTVAYISYEDLPEKDICYEPSIIVKSRGIIGFEYYDKPFSHKNEMWAYHSEDESISIKYVYYYLVRMESVFQRIGSTMQMPQISIPDTDNYKIPIPPLSVQGRIVEILDKFDTLVNSISEGLPREIELRRKQYEYYCDALLSFEPLISNL